MLCASTAGEEGGGKVKEEMIRAQEAELECGGQGACPPAMGTDRPIPVSQKEEQYLAVACLVSMA